MNRPILIAVSTAAALVLLLMAGKCAMASECLPSAEAVWKGHPTSWAVQRHDGCWHKGARYVAGTHHKHTAGKGMVRGKSKAGTTKMAAVVTPMAPVSESVSSAIINCAATDLDGIHACFREWERRQANVSAETR
jgi:hypothetical protein